MILFTGLSRFSGHFCVDGPSPLNRDTTVYQLKTELDEAVVEYQIFPNFFMQGGKLTTYKHRMSFDYYHILSLLICFGLE